MKRERLYNFSGRSRKSQISLAREIGLTDYPAPAGGCLLTEPNYSYRLRELLGHNPDPSIHDLALLRVGRHFRFSPTCKAVVGRDENENAVLESFADRARYRLHVEGFGSPVVLLTGADSRDFVTLAASLCARYSDAKSLPEVDVTVSESGYYFAMRVSPACNDLLATCRIEKPDDKTVRSCAEGEEGTTPQITRRASRGRPLTSDIPLPL